MYIFCMSTKRADSPYDLCKFEYADGRFCALPAIASLDGYCRSHSARHRRHPLHEDNEDLSLELPLFTSDPPSQEDIHCAISRIFRALAANRISNRRAATFGYLAQILLATSGDNKPKITSNAIYDLWREAVDQAYPPQKSHSPANQTSTLSK